MLATILTLTLLIDNRISETEFLAFEILRSGIKIVPCNESKITPKILKLKQESKQTS